MRKTVKIEHLISLINYRLSINQSDKYYKKALCDLLETILSNCDAYKGYSFIHDNNNGVGESNFYCRQYY